MIYQCVLGSGGDRGNVEYLTLYNAKKEVHVLSLFVRAKKGLV